jgi:hypothetical protein
MGEEQAFAALLAAEELAVNVRELLALRERVLLLEAKPAQQARKRARSRERAVRNANAELSSGYLRNRAGSFASDRRPP